MSAQRQLNTPEAGIEFAVFGAGHRSRGLTAGLGGDPETRTSFLVPKLLLSPAGAASALSISRSKVYRLLREGRLESVMLDGNRRITMASLEKLVDDLLGVATARDNGRTSS